MSFPSLLYRAILALLEISGNTASDVSVNFWIDSFGSTFSGNFTILVLSNVWSIVVACSALIALLLFVLVSSRKSSSSSSSTLPHHQPSSPQTVEESFQAALQSNSSNVTQREEDEDENAETPPQCTLRSLFFSRVNLLCLVSVSLADFSINLFGTYAAGHVPVVDQVIMKSMEPLLCFLLYTAVWRAEDTKLIFRALSEGRARLWWHPDDVTVRGEGGEGGVVYRGENDEEQHFGGGEEGIAPCSCGNAEHPQHQFSEFASEAEVICYFEPLYRFLRFLRITRDDRTTAAYRDGDSSSLAVPLTFTTSDREKKTLVPEEMVVENDNRFYSPTKSFSRRFHVAFRRTWVILFLGPLLSLLVAALGVVAAMWSTLQKENQAKEADAEAFDRRFSYVAFWLTMYGLRVVSSAAYNVAQGAFMKYNYGTFVEQMKEKPKQRAEMIPDECVPRNSSSSTQESEGERRSSCPSVHSETVIRTRRTSSSSLLNRLSVTNWTKRQRHLLLSLLCLLFDFSINFVLLMSFGPLLDTISFAGWGDSDSVSDSWNNLHGGMKCVFYTTPSASAPTSSSSGSMDLPSTCKNCLWYALITNVAWVVVYMADSFLNEMSPALNSIVNMMTGPVTVFALLVFPSLNVYGGGVDKDSAEQVELQVAAAVCVIVSLGLFVWFDWFVERLRQSYKKTSS